MNTGPRLEEAVREAHDRTGVPGVVAGIWHDGSSSFAAEGRLALGRDEPVHEDTPFRIASITKSFTATLAERCLPLDEPLCRLLSHTGGLRCESTEPLPPAAAGLFSYSNAGYWGGGVFGFARGVLMSHRLDFPRVGFARIGWVVLPRVES